MGAGVLLPRSWLDSCKACFHLQRSIPQLTAGDERSIVSATSKKTSEREMPRLTAC